VALPLTDVGVVNSSQIWEKAPKVTSQATLKNSLYNVQYLGVLDKMGVSVRPVRPFVGRGRPHKVLKNGHRKY